VFASPPTQITGFYLIDSLLTGNFASFRSSFNQLLFARIDAVHLLTGANRAP